MLSRRFLRIYPTPTWLTWPTWLTRALDAATIKAQETAARP